MNPIDAVSQSLFLRLNGGNSMPTVPPHRRTLRVLAASGLALLGGCAGHRYEGPALKDLRAAAPPWQAINEATASQDCRRLLERARTQFAHLPATSLMATRGETVLLSVGRVDRPSIVYSVRKSLLAMLYGRYVKDGSIDLDRTLADLGIDDVGGLLPLERQATVWHLLSARSGVFHPAANVGDDSAAAPPRGSQRPGQYFLYNNWDFNAAGTVFEQLTQRAIYEAFEHDLAAPLGLQDFVLADQHRSGDASRSRHLAYPLQLSTRDMVRLGQLMLAQGRWNGRQLIPADWIATITAPVTRAQDMHPPHTARRGIDYGYMWWIPQEPADSPLSGSYMAWGMFGQFILVVPGRGLVLAQKHDLTRAERAGETAPQQIQAESFLAIARTLADAPCP